MSCTTVNTNIWNEVLLPPPSALLETTSATEEDYEFVTESRATITDILNGKDSRLLCVVGPCSIHNTTEAIEYAKCLKELRALPNIFIVMRTYCEKPRTVTGWKGLMYDPRMDNSNDILSGLIKSRTLLLTLTRLGIPCACELLDTILPQYYSDLVSWGCIGARTCESQLHRQLVSGLSMPVGFKNSTSGCIRVAIDSILAARRSHSFPGLSFSGSPAILQTTGNQCTHIVLRGSSEGPNYDAASIENVRKLLDARDIPDTAIVVDCSHGNSGKDYRKQRVVLMDLLEQKPRYIRGVMLESNIKSGSQVLDPDDVGQLRYGVSITDGCIDLEETKELCESMSRALEERRTTNQVRSPDDSSSSRRVMRHST